MSDTDKTAPWYEFISYIRCCESLGVPASVQRFFGYRRYLKEVGVIK
jgi:hypothetical protein